MPSVDRQAAQYFWDQAEIARRNGDEAYASKMEDRAGQWANGGVA